MYHLIVSSSRLVTRSEQSIQLSSMSNGRHSTFESNRNIEIAYRIYTHTHIYYYTQIERWREEEAGKESVTEKRTEGQAIEKERVE